jgi:proteasome lid subunit RPN8/RPN11
MRRVTLSLGLTGLLTSLAGPALAQSAKSDSFKNVRPDGYIAPEDIIWNHDKSEAEIEFVKAHLDSLQEKSFRENREYCGYIFVDEEGGFHAGRDYEGTESGCGVALKNARHKAIATYHTHGGYLAHYENELPSPDDLLNDLEEALDGYISTPGGRMWLTDAERDAAILLCKQGCLKVDEDFEVDESRVVKERYTLRQIRLAVR